jgi:hypothetical protein
VPVTELLGYWLLNSMAHIPVPEQFSAKPNHVLDICGATRSYVEDFAFETIW